MKVRWYDFTGAGSFEVMRSQSQGRFMPVRRRSLWRSLVQLIFGERRRG